MKFRTTSTQFFLFYSLYLAIFLNLAFFKQATQFFPIHEHNFFFITSLGLVLVFIQNLIFNFLFIPTSFIKFSAILILILASQASYVMNHLGIPVDENMVRNIFQTSFAEASDLFNLKSFLYFALGAILPSWFIFNLTIEKRKAKTEWMARAKSVLISLFVSIALISLQSKKFATFFREYKPVRYYANPSYFIYSTFQFMSKSSYRKNEELKPIATSALISKEDDDRDLLIIVVGETARADHFSLNNYHQETNPLLKNQDIITFSEMFSCGTSTAISVPCLFSHQGREHFQVDSANQFENLLDVLKKTNQIELLWRDNNSSSKGVADRITYQDFQSSKLNPDCDEECRDVGMLSGLQDFINQSQKKDIVIVLHQMGNHGPAYYKRYPKDFARFTPYCQSNDLGKCTDQEIINAYDNAILYTDYFLNETIEFLKNNSKHFYTSLLYVSDHGESLGENGVYLHSMPYFIAPKAQKHVAALYWSNSYKNHNEILLKEKALKSTSHDIVFHSVLGLLEIETDVYRPELDFFSNKYNP